MGRVWRLFWFTGRADRREYWLLAVLFTTWIWGGLFVFTAVSDESTWFAGILLLLVVPSGIVANLALGARRLHDRGKSAWWMAPYYGVPNAAAVGFAVIPEENDLILAWLLLPLLGPLLAALVDLGVLDGTPGPNRYGADPAGRLNLEVFD